MKQLKLNVSTRQGKGRGASRRDRSAGKIPAILYGKNNEPVQLTVATPEFRRLVKAIGGSASLIEIERPGGGPTLSFIREIQRNPITDEYVHIDLHEVSSTDKMSVSVTVHAVGESTGVKNEAGVLEVVSHQIHIRCLPKDLPEFIEVDVTELAVNHTIHIKELKPIAGVEFLDHPNQPVISCVEPAKEEEVVVTAAVPVEGAVPAEGAAAAPGAEGAAAPAAGAAGDKKAGAPAAAGAAAAAPAAGAKKAPAAPAKK
jgi:large subunit ribosomal protein L25